MSTTFNYVTKFVNLDLFTYTLYKNLSGLRQLVSTQYSSKVN